MACFEGNPVGGIDEAIAAHFRLNQNACYTVASNGELKSPTQAGISMTGWSDSIGRLGLGQRALNSEGDGRIVISDVNNIFAGSYILNQGYENYGKWGHYLYYRDPISWNWESWHPYPVSSTNHFNGTYNFWILIDELPTSPVPIFERLRVSGEEWSGASYNLVEFMNWYANNESLQLSLLSSGRLLVTQNGEKQVMEQSSMRTNHWTMVTFVGVEGESITLFQDGKEVGHIPSVMSFGYFPPTDNRCLIDQTPGQSITYFGSIVPLVESFTIGGWNGAIDEVTLYDQALTPEQVADLYDGNKQRYVFHAVTQVLKGQSIEFPEIGAQLATNVVKLGATASSGLDVEYEVVSGPGVVEDGLLTFTGPGTVVVTASQTGDESWSAAEPVTREVEVEAVPTVVTLGSLEQAFNGEARVVTVETVPEGVAVRVTYDGEEEAPIHAGSYAVWVETTDARFSGSAEGTLTVGQASQSIVFPSIGEQIWTNKVALSATSGSGLAVAFEVLSGPGVLNGDVLGFEGPGTVTVVASQAGDRDWTAAESVSQEITVTKAMATVTLSGLAQVHDGGEKRVGVATVPEGLAVHVTYDGGDEAPVGAGSYAVTATVVDEKWEGSVNGTLVVAKGSQTIAFDDIGSQVTTNTIVLGAVASSGLAVAYEVEGPVVLAGNVLAFTGAGDVTVTASQAGDANWEAAEAVGVSFEVVKATAEVTLSGLEQVYDGEAKRVDVTTGPTGLAVSVTYDGAEEAPVGTGSYAVMATVEDAIWAGSAEGTLVISKGSQSVEFEEIGRQIATNVVTLGATASSGLSVSYAVEGPAVLEGNVLTFTGAGTVTVRASQSGDENWEAAEAVSVAFAVAKATAEVTLSGLEQVYDGEAKRMEVTTGPEGLAVRVTYDGVEEAPIGAGNYAVVATVEDAIWAGSAEGTLVVSKGSQTIAFEAIGGQVATNVVVLGAVASSGLAVAYEVEGPAVLEGNVLTFTGGGTVVVTASQAGDENWEAAEAVSVSFEVVKATAEVTLSGLEQVYDGEAKSVEVTTGLAGLVGPEGLAVRVTYDGSEVAPTNAGEYAVVAVVEDAIWEGSAEGVLVVAKAGQSIDFPEIGAQVVTNEVVLGAVASSGLAVEYEVVSGLGKVEGNVLTFTGAGEVVVRASQGGNENWEAAESVERTVEVSGWVTLTVESAHGTAEPGVGEHEVLLGTVVEASVVGSPVELGEGWRAVCTGWRLEGEGIEASGEGTEAAFEAVGDAVLTWVWETQVLVRAEALAHGETSGGGWYAVGATAVLEATPEEGHRFTGWEGDFGASGANPLEVTAVRPGGAVATFFTTYYASGDGDDGADGLSRGTAKREISAALEEAARGDTVVTAEGVYGAIVVPEGVTVRSEEGAEKTVIRGGEGTRCVESAAGTLVEGFTLEGGDVEGDGGGALLEEGAELKRCILRGNKAGGEGGGAKGGLLENCLVARNEAGSGGGVAGAVLRHCTVVENMGGGAKGCQTENSVLWGNEGGDVEGGTTAWSLSLPAAAGAGNIEDEPKFAGSGDWRPTYESPFVDAAGVSGVRTDLEGAPRPQPRVFGEALKPDMGCYEYVPKARFVWEKGSAVPPYETWAEAANDIQSALDISGGGDRVVVEAGTYGAVTVSNAVVVMGYRGAAETVIDGRGSERAVTMTGGGVLEGFTVKNGASEDCGGILADGGAVVRDVVVEGCRATGAEGVGGGLCLYGGSTAENVTARGNQAAYGGGIYATATSAVERCEMTGNAASAWGGGAWLGDESRMLGSVVTENTAVRGAGAYGESCEIADCEMRGNVATGAGGGAAVERGTFRNNVVEGNTAGSGGGLFAKDTDGHDCLVVGNSAAKGAGVWSEGDGQLWNFTVADNEGTGAGVALRKPALLGNSIAWGNAGGNLDAASGTEVRFCCIEPVAAGEGNFAEEPQFVGGGDYHLRAGSPCVDAGEVQKWMPEAYDLDGQRRVEKGEEQDMQDGKDGKDIWVDVGADEAAQDAVGGPIGDDSIWTWRVVMDARLQLQSTTNLLKGASWTDAGEPFTATNQVWTLDEPFEGKGARFYRLIWLKE